MRLDFGLASWENTSSYDASGGLRVTTMIYYLYYLLMRANFLLYLFVRIWKLRIDVVVSFTAALLSREKEQYEYTKAVLPHPPLSCFELLSQALLVDSQFAANFVDTPRKKTFE